MLYVPFMQFVQFISPLFFNKWKTFCYRKSERIWSHESLVLDTRCNLFSIQCRSAHTSKNHIRLAHATRFKVQFNTITLTCMNIKSLGISIFLHVTEAHQCCLTGYRVLQCIIFFKNLLSRLFFGLSLKSFPIGHKFTKQIKDSKYNMQSDITCCTIVWYYSMMILSLVWTDY